MKSFFRGARIVLRAVVNRRTPLKAKLILGSGLVYGLLPLDLVPDLLPLLGMIDDATIALIVILAFLHMTKSIRRNLENEERYIPRS